MKKNLGWIAVSICILFALTGCRTGSSVMPLAPDLYKISYSGNAFTSQNTVLDRLLRKCAQLTIQHGYRYFVIMAGDTTVDSRTWQTPDTVRSSYSGTYSPYGNNFDGSGTAVVNHGVPINIKKFQSVAIIKMLHNKKHYPNAFDAYFIDDNYN